MSPIFALLFAVACDTGPSVEAMQKGVESALVAKDYPGAVAKADEALSSEAVANDAAKAWRFESMRLEALAESGKGADVAATLERLGDAQQAYGKQITPALFRSLADKLKLAGDGAGTVTVLDAGLKRFPEDPSFRAALDDLASGADPEEIARLKALGYL